MRFSVLMFLHRDSFKRALTGNPMDPLISAHSYSFTTTYECACVMLDSTINLYAKAKCLGIPRVWRIWTNAFCAAVGNVLRRRRIVAHHNFRKSFPGRNRSRRDTYPESKFRTPSPFETRGCMCFI